MQSFAHSTACKKCTHPTKLLLSSLSFYPWMGRRIPKVFLSSLSYLDIDSLDVLLSHFWLHFWKAHFYTMILMIRPYRYWKWTNARFFSFGVPAAMSRFSHEVPKGREFAFDLTFVTSKYISIFLRKLKRKTNKLHFKLDFFWNIWTKKM